MNSTTQLRVWDPLIRVFHWTLVVAVLTAYFTEGDQLDLHVAAGYTVLGLIAFRLIWGFAGTRHARFVDFVFAPRVVWTYLKDLPKGTAARFIGHNPAGGAMIVALLLSLTVTTFSGVAFYGADRWLGPLAGIMQNTDDFWIDVLKETHEIAANFTILLAAVHVCGVAFESWLHQENLIVAMVNGRKRA
ncbi:MAG: cytochrome b/b6 domain-containing protein [Gammaproteobacteria bacterium]|nr:cytochrome b/b6 domain-containing protein [Gammaproteobacteria bacterium]MCP5425506.1 cytochrome b/b6 domain-containing protein [Gammaproteobacteria bacterium]MCP5459374.1 cytochrome b/b6 domain-containing protein [Gammaproteobacteria bacterium]